MRRPSSGASRKRRGRNGDELEQAVREAVAWSATEAVELGIADLVAVDVNDLLAQLDGMEVEVVEGTVILETSSPSIETVEMNLIERSLSFLADPNIAFLLISLGGLG